MMKVMRLKIDDSATIANRYVTYRDTKIFICPANKTELVETIKRLKFNKIKNS